MINIEFAARRCMALAALVGQVGPWGVTANAVAVALVDGLLLHVQVGRGVGAAYVDGAHSAAAPPAAITEVLRRAVTATSSSEQMAAAAVDVFLEAPAQRRPDPVATAATQSPTPTVEAAPPAAVIAEVERRVGMASMSLGLGPTI